MPIPHSITLTIAAAAVTAAASLSGCRDTAQQSTDTESASVQSEWLDTEEFSSPEGMSAEEACQLPGLSWELDTLGGVCSPDTLLILARYNGRLHPTNLLAVKGKLFEHLKTSGNDKIAKGEGAFLEIADFKPKAIITDTPCGSYEEYKANRDTAYMNEKTAMMNVAKDFFLTGGSPQYMRRVLATSWERTCSQAEEYGEKANPFNEGRYAKFVPSSIKVEIADASRGLVEVEAYASDPYTLGYPSTTYWTVAMCKEGEEYKIKELPALHRKFQE